jgi:hypothetical protein
LVKLQRYFLFMATCLFLLGLACQTVTGTEPGSDTPVPLATNTVAAANTPTQPGATAVATETADQPVVTETVDQPEATATTAETVTWDDLVVFENLSQQHDADLRDDYGPLPPAGGTHNPEWQTCGFYSEPLWTEKAIHSLEHGTVWITYDPDLPADQVEYLQGLTEGHSHVLVSPYPGLASDVVLTAWGLQLQIPSLPSDMVEKFIERYENGPQNPEPGAPC